LLPQITWQQVVSVVDSGIIYDWNGRFL